MTDKKNYKYPMIFAIVYGLFNYIWVKSGGKVIYPILAWNNITSYIIAVVVSILIVCLDEFSLNYATNKKLSNIKTNDLSEYSLIHTV